MHQYNSSTPGNLCISVYFPCGGVTDALNKSVGNRFGLAWRVKHMDVIHQSSFTACKLRFSARQLLTSFALRVAYAGAVFATLRLLATAKNIVLIQRFPKDAPRLSNPNTSSLPMRKIQRLQFLHPYNTRIKIRRLLQITNPNPQRPNRCVLA